MSMAEDVDLADFAERSEDATGAEIKAICTEAGMFAIRENRDKVTRKDFLDAIDKLLNSGQATILDSGVMFA